MDKTPYTATSAKDAFDHYWAAVNYAISLGNKIYAGSKELTGFDLETLLLTKLREDNGIKYPLEACQ